MMLIPRYSVRKVLAGTTLAALFCWVLGLATRGVGWAIGIAAGVGSLGLFLAVYVWLFFLVWLVSLFIRGIARRRYPDGRSPFAAINPK